MADTIYRQAAIEALGDEPEVWNDDDDYRLGLLNQWQEDVDAIRGLPSAEQTSAERVGIDPDAIFTISVYDEEHEEHISKRMTVAEILDAYTDEGCPNCGMFVKGTNVLDKDCGAERRGKWIETDMGWDGDIAWVCSVCGEPWTLIDGTPDENCMHYCPNCGAKMEK